MLIRLRRLLDRSITNYVSQLAKAGVFSLVCLAILPAYGAPTFHDEFDGVILGSGWATDDGYALQYPSDAVNHASYSVASSRVSISFPSGAEHNNFWFSDARLLRNYEGTGIYRIKMDTAI